MRILFPVIVFFLVPVSCFSQSGEILSVYFETGKSVLTKTATARLDSFFLKNKDSIGHFEFELKGYCDNRGSDHYNDGLSDKRVATVKKILLRHGMKPEFLISAKGYGEGNPVNENKTAEERQMNRRVDIYVPGKVPGLFGDNQEHVSLKQIIADSATIGGANIILRDINFIGGTHQFLPESQPMLKELLDAMKTFPKLAIRVEGHICCQPENTDGKDLETGLDNLSEARARAVMYYLLSNGIEPGRISYKGYGHSAPIYPYPEKSEMEKTQNRRVEIKIISK